MAREWTDEQRREASAKMNAKWEQKRQGHQTPFGDNPASSPEIPTGAGRARQAPPQAVREGAAAVIERPAPPLAETPGGAVQEPITGEYTIGDQKIVFTPNHTVIFEKKPDESAPVPPPRIGSKELRIIVRTDGTMVSQFDPCICGAPKRQWHTICLKENQNGHAK